MIIIKRINIIIIRRNIIIIIRGNIRVLISKFNNNKNMYTES